jgi:hypothetical protein
MYWKIFVIFLLMGSALWSIKSFPTAATCFEIKPSVEELQQDKGLASKVGEEFSSTALKIWCYHFFVGAFFGSLVFLLFSTRPVSDHYTPAPRVAGPMPGPETMAEVNVTIHVIFIAGAMGFVDAQWILPALQTNHIVVAGPGQRFFASIFEAIVVTVPILPLSLFFAKRMARSWQTKY